MDIIDLQTVHQALYPEIRVSGDISIFDSKMIRQLINKMNKSELLQQNNLKINPDLFSAALQRS